MHQTMNKETEWTKHKNCQKLNSNTVNLDRQRRWFVWFEVHMLSIIIFCEMKIELIHSHCFKSDYWCQLTADSAKKEKSGNDCPQFAISSYGLWLKDTHVHICWMRKILIYYSFSSELNHAEPKKKESHHPIMMMNFLHIYLKYYFVFEDEDLLLA